MVRKQHFQTEELQRLAGLRDKKLISEEEFEAARQKVELLPHSGSGPGAAAVAPAPIPARSRPRPRAAGPDGPAVRVILVLAGVFWLLVLLVFGPRIWRGRPGPARELQFAAQIIDQMRDGLLDIAAGEDQYFGVHGRYAALADLERSPLPHLSVTIEAADQASWRASAKSDFLTGSCMLSGRVTPDRIAKLDGPNCTGTGSFTPAWGELVTAAQGASRAGQGTGSGFLVSWLTGTPSLAPLPDRCVAKDGAGSIAAVDKTLDLGYPVQSVDRLAVRALLINGAYGQLDRMLAAYNDSARQDFRLEYRLFDAYEAFDVAIPDLGGPLDTWVRQNPVSAPARVARGTYHSAAGWAARGTDYVRKTARAGLTAMRAQFDSARTDLDAGLFLEPCSIMARYELIGIAQGPRSLPVLEQGLRIQPYSFLLRARQMNFLRPRWGGSYAMMEKLAGDARPLAGLNPRLLALSGYPAEDQGELLAARDTAGAIQAFDAALATADFWLFRVSRARVSRDERSALQDLDRALAQQPQNVAALQLRAGAAYNVALDAPWTERASLYTRAFRDITFAAALDPADHTVQEDLTFYRENIPQYDPSRQSRAR